MLNGFGQGCRGAQEYVMLQGLVVSRMAVGYWCICAEIPWNSLFITYNYGPRIALLGSERQFDVFVGACFHLFGLLILVLFLSPQPQDTRVLFVVSTMRADVDPDTHVLEMGVTTISRLAPFSALILTVAFVVLFALRYWMLERFLLPKYYGPIYNDLSELNKRGFLNHHIAGGAKVLILIIAAYPFVDVAFGHATLYSSFAGSSLVTMGDVLVVCAQIFIATYVFELLYRVRISPVSTFHHIGTIVIGQAAIAISLNPGHERNADIEFILCTIWGAFDVVCETLPHLSIILYRIYPSSHRFLQRLFSIACLVTFLGTLFETAVVMYVFGSLWSRWITAFKVVTPLLHVAFSATQVHGSFIFYRMAKRQQRLVKEMETGDAVGPQVSLDNEAVAGRFPFGK